MTFKYWYISRWVRKANVQAIFINTLKLVTALYVEVEPPAEDEKGLSTDHQLNPFFQTSIVQ